MSNEEIQECYKNCIEYSKKIKNPILRECCQEIYNDYKEKLLNKPATPGRHHYFKGGLLYHIYSVTRNSYNIAKMYPNLNIDIDLVLFGALLHDIGKTNEYNDFLEEENYIARKGNGAELLGHSYEGVHIVDNYLSKYDIEVEFKNQVLHMIGNHMKEFREEGIFVETKMLEVIIISFADNIDNYLEPASRVIDNAQKGETYQFPKAERPYYKSLNPYYKE
ncbi:MAG: HD domain-containing protein [Clostridia bacterium]|nr:HD domain-containing protein [Clostridia bacterium]